MSLTNLQYETIIRGYERTRDENRRQLTARREQVYDTVPGYRQLDESVSTLSVSMARKLLEDENASMVSLHEALAQIAEQKAALLTQAGFPADYLSPIYRCPHCRDTGYVETTSDPIQTTSGPIQTTSGPIQTTSGLKEKCRCFRLQEITLLYKQSNIQDVLARENFSTLSYEFYEGRDLQRFEAAVNLCHNFVENFKQDYHNLFFYGTVGTGKSFLSGCVANELLKKGYSVIYFSASGLFDSLARYSFDAKAKDSLFSFYSDLYGCDLIIIDDLGTEITNSFVTSQLFACLNERHLQRKATIISTNLSLEELRDRYSDRIFSRITSNYSICKLTGPDIRIHRKRTSTMTNV